MEYKKILLIDLAGIGDMIMSSVPIINLREHYKRAQISILTYPNPAKAVFKCPLLNQVHVLSNNFFSGIRNLSVLTSLRKENFDLAINLHQHYSLTGALKMRILLFLINAKKTAGRNTDGKAQFYDIKILDTIYADKHNVDYKLELLQAVGCPIKEKRLRIWFDEVDVKEANKFLKENSISETDLIIGINPGAARISHRWPWQRFKETAEHLINNHEAKIIITGSREDSLLAQRIKQEKENVIVATGKLSMTGLFALMQSMHLFITNDTGPMHIANALGLATVAIMGTKVMKSSPYQKENCQIVKADIDCKICYKQNCRSLDCMQSIKTDQVITAASKLLKEDE